MLAVAAGVVTEARKKSGYGYLVEVWHADGYITRYAHNSEVKVKTGDLVDKGQVIALMGSSGRSTGPHVHFEIRRNNVKQCPDKYLVEELVPAPPITEPDFPVLPQAKSSVVLNVRVRPKVGAKVLYQLGIGEKVPALEQMVYADGDIWVRIGYKSWCAMRYKGNVYLTYIDSV